MSDRVRGLPPREHRDAYDQFWDGVDERIERRESNPDETYDRWARDPDATYDRWCDDD